MTRALLARAGILLCVLFISARAGTMQTASAADAQLPLIWSNASGDGQLKSGALSPVLVDDHANAGDHDGDHHKSPGPGPTRIPEPSPVLLFGAALLASGTILRCLYCSAPK